MHICINSIIYIQLVKRDNFINKLYFYIYILYINTFSRLFSFHIRKFEEVNNIYLFDKISIFKIIKKNPKFFRIAIEKESL